MTIGLQVFRRAPNRFIDSDGRSIEMRQSAVVGSFLRTRPQVLRGLTACSLQFVLTRCQDLGTMTLPDIIYLQLRYFQSL